MQRERPRPRRAEQEAVQLEIPGEVLLRLLLEGSLVASEIRCLNHRSSAAAREAIKACLMASSRRNGRARIAADAEDKINPGADRLP